MENNSNRRERVVQFGAVRWIRMRWIEELVDSEIQRFEIIHRPWGHIVRSGSIEMPLGQFLLSHPIGRRVRYVFLRSGVQKLEALDGAILDLYPPESEREGYGSIVIEGGTLDGRQF
jgi:hypothetical protein